MKKLIAFTLVAIMCLSLCACGADAEKIELYDKYERLIGYMEDEKYEKALSYIWKKAENNQQNDEPDAVPDGNPDDALYAEEYEDLLNNLENLEDSIKNDYTFGTSYQPEGSEEWVWVDGSEAMLMLRDRLLALDGYKDSRELAARFVPVEDVIISINETWTDALGNANENIEHDPYAYDANGRIIKGLAPEQFQDVANGWSRYDYEYDASGKLVGLKEMWNDTIEAIFTISYNADGTIASTEYKNSSGSTRNDTYIYEEGRLVQRTYVDNYNNNYVVNYTYNDAGQLVMTQEEEVRDYTWRYVTTVAYTYDASGKVETKRESQYYYYNNELQDENYVHLWTYTYEGDRLVTALDTHLGNFNEKGEQTDTNLDFPRTYTYVYGSYCLYMPEN